MNIIENKEIEYLEESNFLRKCCYGLKSKIDFFLGSGASKSSGIPIGQEVVWRLKRDIFCSETGSPRNIDLESRKEQQRIQKYLNEKGIYPSAGEYNEYAWYFNEAFGDDEKSTEIFIKELMKDSLPSIGYKYLGAILLSDFTNTVWTTNFDTLVQSGINCVEPNNNLITYSIENPPDFKQLQKEEYPCVCKLHGDFRYGQTKNTTSQVKSLSSKLEDNFIKELNEKGLVVVGYSGSDDSIMTALNKNMGDPSFLSNGIYWLKIINTEIPSRVEQLLKNAIKNGKKAYVIDIKNFDSFFENLYNQLGINNKAIENLKKEAIVSINTNSYLFKEKKHTEKIIDVSEIKETLENEIKNINFIDIPNICIKLLNQKADYNLILDQINGIQINDKNLIKQSFDLINYTESMFEKRIDKEKNYIFYIYGFDEIPDSLILQIQKQIINLLYFYENIRIILIGRNASFIQDFEEKISSKSYIISTSNNIELKPETIIKNDNLELIKNISDIDVYKQFSTDETNFLKIIKKFIDYTLIYDKQRFDSFRNISYRQVELSKINLEKVNDCLKNISFKLSLKTDKYITENKIKEIINNPELFDFIIKSNVINYYNNNKISLMDDYVIYYYCILNILTESISRTQELLFLKTNKVNEKFLIILYLILKTIDKESRVYRAVIKRLKKISSVYILLTNYKNLTAIKKFNAYNRIVNEFNHTQQLIYYARFIQNPGLLRDIDSLSDALHNLLPEEFYKDAITKHCDYIKTFLKNPLEKKIKEFENNVILLGVHAKFWNEPQYNKLKEISIPLIKFFRKHPLAERMKGLLSEDIILNWYEDYNWTKDWNEKEWNDFVQNITETENKNFYIFESEEDFRFKLKLFNHFNKNAYIQKLLSPIAQKILNNKTIESDSAAVVPRKLDDNFETPIIHFDNDISIFTYLIKQNGILISDILKILNNCNCGYLHHTSIYQIEELYREIKTNFNNSLKSITDDEITELYKLFVNYINTESGLYLSDFNEFLKQLSDTHKELFFNLFINDLEKNKDWQNLWMLDNSIVLLLNISEKKKATNLFSQIKNLGRIYTESVANIYISKWESHPLYETCFNEYPVLFAKQVEKEEIRNQRLKKFETETKEMFEKEIQIITNKELFIKEAENVINYIDTQKNTSKRDTDRGDLLDLQVEYIGNKIQYGDIDNYKAPPVFSLFTIKYLFNFTDDKQNLDREKAIKNIEEWFSDEKYFWRYFFWLYVCHYKKEDSEVFIKKNPDLIDKIKKSMEMEVIDFLSNDEIEIYDGGQNRRWVVPFVYYLKKLFNNKLPSWVDKNKILNFIAYPAWQLSTGFGAHTNGEFKWENWNSVCEWIVEVSGITTETIIQKALEVLPLLKYDQSQTQIITIFVEKVKTDTVYKQQMLNSILNKTIIEIQKDYTDHSNTSIMNGGALSSFWRETNENFVDDLYPYLNFSKYNPDDINYCRKMVFEYFCRMASEEQKNKTIALLRERINEENVKFYLAKLGYEEAIIKIIDEFIQGKSFETDYAFFSPLFGKAKKSKILLEKYYELYEYSIAKNNDRRQYLTAYAKEGIFQSVEENNFKNIKRKLEKLINKRKKLGLYFEGIQDFLNEIEQRVYGKNKIGEKDNENNN